MNKFLHTFSQGLILISCGHMNILQASGKTMSHHNPQSQNTAKPSNPSLQKKPRNLVENLKKINEEAIESRDPVLLKKAIKDQEIYLDDAIQHHPDKVAAHQEVLDFLKGIEPLEQSSEQQFSLSIPAVTVKATQDKPALEKQRSLALVEEQQPAKVAQSAVTAVKKQLFIEPVVVVEQASQSNLSSIKIDQIMDKSKVTINSFIESIISISKNDNLTESDKTYNIKKIAELYSTKLLDNVFILQDGKIKEIKNLNLTVPELQQAYKNLIASYDKSQQAAVTELLTPVMKELKDREPSWLQQTMMVAGDVLGIADTATQVTAAAVRSAAQDVQENVQAFHEDVTAPLLKTAHENLVAPAAQKIHDSATTTMRKAADRITGRPEEKAVKFITKTEPCNDGMITKKIQEKLGVEKTSKPDKPLSIKTTSLTGTVLESAIPSNAPEMVQTITGTKKILSDITQGLYRMLGYPPKISLTVQSEINQTAQKIVADRTVTTEKDRAKFNKKLKKYISAIIPKLISLITKEDPRNIQIIEIPVSSGDLLAAQIKISYNKSTNKIQSAIVTYDGRSYNLDVSKLKIAEDGSCTISSPLYNKSQKPSLMLEYMIKPIAKTLGKKVVNNVKYEDQATQNLYKTLIDFVYDKITDLNSDGQIEIVARINKDTGETFLVKKTITQKQADASMQTVSQQAEQTNIELKGRAGDRFAPKIKLSINTDNQLQEFDIQHELFYSQGNKLKRETIKPISKSIDYNDDTYTMVAIFQETGNTTISAELKNLWQAINQVAVTEPIVQPAIFEGEVLQNMRAADPAAEHVLKQTQAYTAQATDKAIEMVVATYNKNTKDMTTYTIKLMADNSRTITRLSYPIRDSEVILNRTIKMPESMTNINIESLQGLFIRKEYLSN